MIKDRLDVHAILLAEVLILGQIGHQLGEELRVDAHSRQLEILHIANLLFENIETRLDNDLLGVIAAIVVAHVDIECKL